MNLQWLVCAHCQYFLHVSDTYKDDIGKPNAWECRIALSPRNLSNGVFLLPVRSGPLTTDTPIPEYCDRRLEHAVAAGRCGDG